VDLRSPGPLYASVNVLCQHRLLRCIQGAEGNSPKLAPGNVKPHRLEAYHLVEAR